MIDYASHHDWLSMQNGDIPKTDDHFHCNLGLEVWVMTLLIALNDHHQMFEECEILFIYHPFALEGLTSSIEHHVLT